MLETFILTWGLLLVSPNILYLRKGPFVAVTWPERSELVWLLNCSLHETIWLSLNWLIDADADSRRARVWPLAWEARKHSFWQLPPSSSLHPSLWSRTQSGCVWVRFTVDLSTTEPNLAALIGKRFVRYEAHRERFQHLCTEWVTKSQREAHRWSRWTHVHM